ncbi:hypothetical protein C8T65DRAFT_744177 [Cerioporus squamosus]|nr:hypothetical protein C8T65DRAFT_744177 [Cerioporus squamosus]
MNDAQVLQAYQLFKDVLHSGAATCLSDEALDTLDRELLFAVSVIRTRINSSRRYAQLPAEILTAIFQHVLAPSTHFLSDSGHARKPIVSPAPEGLSISLLCGIFPTDTFPALVHLRIEGSQRYPIKIDMFLRFLSGTPLIETLHTSSVIPVQGAVFKAVSLPRIRVFSLTDIDDSVVSNISQDIIVPPEAMILLHHIRVRLNHVLWPSQFPLPALDGITDLELAENGKQLHIRARGRCSAIWLHFSGAGFMLSHKILPIVLSQYSPLLSTVATVRIAVEPYSSLPSSLEHILPAVQEFCPATSTLIIASSPDEQPDHRSSVLRHDSGETRIAPLAFPAVENLHIQVSRPLLDQDIFLEMLRAHVIQGHPLASLTFSAPGGLAVADGDYSVFTKHVGRVESTATKLWDPEGDAFWRRRNEYWPLYPDAGDLKEAWGLPSVGAW